MGQVPNKSVAAALRVKEKASLLMEQQDVSFRKGGLDACGGDVDEGEDRMQFDRLDVTVACGASLMDS